MNKQKGSVSVLLVLLVIVLVSVAGYFAFIKKAVLVSPPVTQTPSDIQSPQTDSANTQSSTTAKLSIAGMQQYTDSDFGFSFWYPKGLKVTKDTKPVFPNENIKNATVVATLNVEDTEIIEEVHSTTRTLTDTINQFGTVTYTFDTMLHAWMVSSESDIGKSPMVTPQAKANIDENTMGGLHMFPGVFPYNTVIIPLSANNFLVIDDENGGPKTAFFARTVMALDPSVATPVSTPLQTKTIQTAAQAFVVPEQNTGMQTFSDPLDGFSFQYPTNAKNGYATLSWMPSVFVTHNKTNIDSHGCYLLYGNGYEPNGVHGTQETINNISYCLSEDEDAGAGQLGTSYYYTTYKNGTYITIGYQVSSTNGCGAYDENSAGGLACKAGQKSYDTDIMKPIEQSVGSLTFSS